MEKKVIVTVEFAGDNLSAYIEGAPIMTTGNNLKEIAFWADRRVVEARSSALRLSGYWSARRLRMTGNL